MNDKIKGALRSTVIWLNGLLLAAFPLIEMAKEELPGLAQFLTPDVYKRVGLAVVVLNILLRFRTTKSLQEKGQG